MVADALSRQHEDEVQPNALNSTTIMPEWVKEVESSYEQDEFMHEKITTLAISPNAIANFTYKQGILRYKNRVCIGSNGELRGKILQLLHDSPQGGHSGVQATYYRLKLHFFWPGMKAQVKTHVDQCDICRRNKNENVPYPGLLQPIPIPKQAWEVITMDFIEGLPQSNKHNCVMVIIDKFTKYGHFL
ncbi:MAG: integrase zinc binding domain-containing protein, partial [Candidatus Phytoplasma australasiaticum]|nr:integrase zinc binding domain-containing protein [Candidatus Phytoplasma australasiaticum]